MDELREDPLPELVGGTARQRFLAGIARKSLLDRAHQEGDPAMIATLVAETDPGAILGTFRRAKAAAARAARPPEPAPEDPAVAALRGRLSAPWWDARRMER